ncbi:MAG: hypothetical protein V4640_07440 [Verrucomicrobiota bacterium]
MDTSPRYILSRAIFLIAVLVAALYGMRYFKKWQRQNEVTAALTSIASDSSYFHQFYAADAQKSLVRAVGLIAEANSLGIPPETIIARATGTEKKTFVSDDDPDEVPIKTQIVINSLRLNYENFIKLGYKVDYKLLGKISSGELPPIPSGPGVGSQPIVATFIDAAASPGIEKVLANLEIRPPHSGDHVPTDIEIAAAKRLASQLSEAGIIEESVRNKIDKNVSEKAVKQDSAD